METMLTTPIFAVLGFSIGLGLLIKGSGLLVKQASRLATSLAIPRLIIGLVVLSFGTSLPELAVSWSLSFRGGPGDLIIANVLGSNIANVLLVLGTAACLGNISIPKGEFLKHLAMGTVALVWLILFLMIFSPLAIERWEGAIGGIIFLVYLWILYRTVKRDPLGDSPQDPEGEQGRVTAGTEGSTHKKMLSRTITLLFLAIVVITIGGELVSRYALIVAVDIMHANEAFAGIVLLALGTSLPELITSIVAYRQGENNLLVGNILGSNIFNILFILTTSSLIQPLAGLSGNYYKELFVHGLSLVCLLFFYRSVLTRRNGLILLSLYGIYLYDFLRQNMTF